MFGNYVKDFTVDNMKETGPDEYVYDFLVVFESIDAVIFYIFILSI